MIGYATTSKCYRFSASREVHATRQLSTDCDMSRARPSLRARQHTQQYTRISHIPFGCKTTRYGCVGDMRCFTRRPAGVDRPRAEAGGHVKIVSHAPRSKIQIHGFTSRRNNAKWPWLHDPGPSGKEQRLSADQRNVHSKRTDSFVYTSNLSSSCTLAAASGDCLRTCCQLLSQA